MKEFVLSIFILLISTCCYASMQLYISSDCQNCEVVLYEGKEAIERLESEGELEVFDVTDIETDLPALPALVDGEKIIIGTGLLKYLGDRAKVEFSPGDEQLFLSDDCPHCQE